MSVSAATIGLRLMRRSHCAHFSSISTSFLSPSSSIRSSIRPLSPSSLLFSQFRPTNHTINFLSRRTYAKKATKKSSAPLASPTVRRSERNAANQSSNEPRYFSLEENLARSKHEVVLFSSYPNLLINTFYIASLVSISWAGWEFYENVLMAPESAPQWTKSVSAVGAGFGILMFLYFFWVPSRLLTRIVAVPKRVPNGTPTLRLQLTTKTLLPFRNRVLDVAPSEAVLEDTFYKPRKVVEPWDFSGIIGKFKWVGFQFVRMGKAFMRTLKMEDFIALKVKGRSMALLMDRNGWCWEREKKGLDMLLKGQRSVLRYGQR